MLGAGSAAVTKTERIPVLLKLAAQGTVQKGSSVGVAEPVATALPVSVVKGTSAVPGMHG